MPKASSGRAAATSRPPTATRGTCRHTAVRQQSKRRRSARTSGRPVSSRRRRPSSRKPPRSVLAALLTKFRRNADASLTTECTRPATLPDIDFRKRSAHPCRDLHRQCPGWQGRSASVKTLARPNGSHGAARSPAPAGTPTAPVLPPPGRRQAISPPSSPRCLPLPWSGARLPCSNRRLTCPPRVDSDNSPFRVNTIYVGDADRGTRRAMAQGWRARRSPTRHEEVPTLAHSQSHT